MAERVSKKRKIMVATPCLSKVDTLFHSSCLGIQHDQDTEVIFYTCEGSLVYDSRNKLVNAAIEKGFDYVLWIDSDMVFQPDLLEKMLYIMENGEIDFLSALCFRRQYPYTPVIMKRLYVEEGIPKSEAYEDYPQNEYFEIAASGFGCVMTSQRILKDIRDRYNLPFSPILGWGEDYSFCIRANDLGYKLYCCSAIKVGHISMQIIDESVYEEVRRKKDEIQRNNSGV